MEKRGDTFTMFLSNHGEPLHQVGASIKLHLDGPFYVGIGLSSHNPAVTEKATFSNVELKQLTPPATPARLTLYSTLQAIEIADNSRRATILYSQPGRFQAPNWSRDGKSLVFNQEGRIYQIPVAGGTPQLTRYRRGHQLHRQSRLFARRQVACHHLFHAGPSGSAHLHRSLRRWHAPPGH